MAILDGFLDKASAARELGVSTRTLDRWWSERIGPPRIKIGAKVMYRVEAVRAWMLAQESVPVRSSARVDKAA